MNLERVPDYIDKAAPMDPSLKTDIAHIPDDMVWEVSR